MHDRGLCHRDISMENIVLSKSKDGKLIDFGTVGSLPNVSGGPMVPGRVGKSRYMAPEVRHCHLHRRPLTLDVCFA